MRDAQGNDELAPVFDNGGCLQTKISEEKIEVQILEKNLETTRKNASNIQTAYALNGHILSGTSFLELANQYTGLRNAIEKVVPNIQRKMPEIIDFISESLWVICISGRSLPLCMAASVLCQSSPSVSGRNEEFHVPHQLL